MRCPRCNTQVAAGAAVCQQCDEILDPSQFASEDDYAEDDGDRTDVGPAPTSAQAAQAARARAVAQAAKAPPRPQPKIQAQEPARRPYLADAAPPPAPDALEEASRSVDELAAFFRSLSMSDRASAGAGMLLVVLLALPWRWTKADDDTIGFIAAFPAGILAGAVVGLVYYRARRATASLAASLKMAQLGSALLLAGFCAWFLRNANDERVIRGTSHMLTTVISAPGIGAYLGCACAMVMLITSVSGALADRGAR